MSRQQDPWQGVSTEDEIKCGLISIDLVGSSAMTAPAFQQFMTKQNLQDTVRAVAIARGAKIFTWAGDGGLLGYRIRRPRDDYDQTVSLGIVVLGLMHAFNADPINGNKSAKPIELRVVGDVGEVIYSEDHGVMHGRSINFILKAEKHIGSAGSLVLTDALYSQLLDPKLQEMFKSSEIDRPTGSRGASEHHRVHEWKFSP